MSERQSIELLGMTASNKSALFKVLLDGEEKILVGKQTGLLSEQSSKVQSLKTLDSFQKGYEIDRDETDDEIKKDIILPVVISQDIVQFGDYMFSLSKMTNNSILYLIYKNRLINRYVEEGTETVYYNFDDRITSACGKDSEKILEYIRDNFTAIDSNTGEYYAVEKMKNYSNLEGLEFDDTTITDKTYNMPFNMLYEYSDELQYSSEESQIYVNYLNFKNHLTPFFNVDVDSSNRFTCWRDFKKIVNNNEDLWVSYNLITPRDSIGNYTFKESDTELEQNLYRIQDFDFIDKIDGIHKLKDVGLRKSNLYSIRLKNTGLTTNPYTSGTDDYNDYEAFRTECTTILETVVNTVCTKTEPINTKLYKVMIDS